MTIGSELLTVLPASGPEPSARSAPEPASTRQRLIAGTAEHLTRRGVADLSLRELAKALGTSHRMLIYHFGSKQGLFVEVVKAMERHQRDELTDAPVRSLAEASRRFWMKVSDPALAPHERLFFELYGQALQGRAYAASFLEGIVDAWLEPGAARLRAEGYPDREARAEARLGVAVVRGLLLDLLATGEREEVDEAFERFLGGRPPVP